MVFGADTYREFVALLGPATEEAGDPWVKRMRSMPLTVVSTTLEGPLDWPGTRPSSAVTPPTSSPGSRRSPRCRCARTAACR